MKGNDGHPMSVIYGCPSFGGFTKKPAPLWGRRFFCGQFQYRVLIYSTTTLCEAVLFETVTSAPCGYTVVMKVACVPATLSR